MSLLTLWRNGGVSPEEREEAVKPKRFVKKRRVLNWTEEELVFLEENSSKFTTKELAKALNKTYSVISYRLKVMKLPVKRERFKVTDEEKSFMIRNKDKMNLRQIAIALGRVPGGLNYQAMQLGIDVKEGVIHWSDEEIEYLINNLDKDRSYLAKRLGRTEGAILSMIYRLRKDGALPEFEGKGK